MGTLKKAWGNVINFFFGEGGPPPAALVSWLTVIFALIGLWFCRGVVGLAAPEVRDYAFKIVSISCISSLAVGFFVGFLFGIPRVLQGVTDDEGNSKLKNRPYEQRVNTNLEQISDWLTKILVGVGLIELKSAPDFLWKVATRLSQSFSTAGTPNLSVAPAICSAVILFAVLGILSGYLLTRLYFASVFAHADQRQETKKGYASGKINASDAPLTQSRPPLGPHSFLPESEKILATLSKYQNEYFSNDDSKRWTFSISPSSQAYPEYIKGVGELLGLGLVAVSPVNNQVMLSPDGLRYLQTNKISPQVDPYGPFSPE